MQQSSPLILDENRASRHRMSEKKIWRGKTEIFTLKFHGTRKSIMLQRSTLLECVNTGGKSINYAHSPGNVDYHEIPRSEKSIEPIRLRCRIGFCCVFAPCLCVRVCVCVYVRLSRACVFSFVYRDRFFDLLGFDSFIFVAKAISFDWFFAVFILLSCNAICGYEPDCVRAYVVCMRLTEPFTNCVLCLFKSLTKSMPLDRTLPRYNCYFSAFSFSMLLSFHSSPLHWTQSIDAMKIRVFSASAKMIFGSTPWHA